MGSPGNRVARCETQWQDLGTQGKVGEVLHSVYTLYMGHTWMVFDPFLVSDCEAHVLSSWVIYFMFGKCELVWASGCGASLTPWEEQGGEGKSLPCKTEDVQTNSAQCKSICNEVKSLFCHILSVWKSKVQCLFIHISEICCLIQKYCF